jgi:hypothetical protein
VFLFLAVLRMRDHHKVNSHLLADVPLVSLR